MWRSLLLALAAGCATTQPVVRLTAPGVPGLVADPPARSVFYSLPRARILVEADLSRTEVSAPRCRPPTGADALEYYTGLGISLAQIESLSAQQGDSVTWALQDVRVTPRTEPDPDQLFAVELKSSALANQQVTLALSELGVLSAGSATSEDLAMSALSDTITVAAGLASRGQYGAGKTAPPARTFCDDAKEQVKRLLRAREGLLSGDTPLDPESIQSLSASLDARLRAALSVFLGESKETQGTLVCSVVPPTRFKADRSPIPGADRLELPLFTYGTRAGFTLNATDRCTLPAALQGSAPASGDARAVTLVVSADPDQIADRLALSPSESSKNSFFYRIPATGRAAVQVKSDKGATITVADLALVIPQYGQIASVPSLTLASRVSVDLSVYDDSGALKSLALDRTGPDLGVINTAGGAAGAILDAAAARKSANTELARLEAELTLLETELAIRDAQQTLQTLDQAEATQPDIIDRLGAFSKPTGNPTPVGGGDSNTNPQQ